MMNQHQTSIVSTSLVYWVEILISCSSQALETQKVQGSKSTSDEMELKNRLSQAQTFNHTVISFSFLLVGLYEEYLHLDWFHNWPFYDLNDINFSISNTQDAQFDIIEIIAPNCICHVSYLTYSSINLEHGYNSSKNEVTATIFISTPLEKTENVF